MFDVDLGKASDSTDDENKGEKYDESFGEDLFDIHRTPPEKLIGREDQSLADSLGGVAVPAQG